jgi:hypothetical protein
MNDTVEMWSMPWHALHRNLALGLGAEAAGCSAPAVSWLSRARRREAFSLGELSHYCPLNVTSARQHRDIPHC